MFNLFSFGSFKGVGMIVLQILRVLTVIALTTSAIACWAMVLHVPKNKTYFVFEAASLVFFSFICAFLVLSEFPVVKFVRKYYRRNWVLFSDFSGPAWLGLAVCLLGCNLLGKLNQPAFDSDKISEPVWQLTVAAGILDIVFGVLNILCALVWMDRKNGITAKDVRSKGSLAESMSQSLPEYTSRSNSPASSIRNEKAKSKVFARLWPGQGGGSGQGKRGTLFGGAGKRLSTRPTISGPIQTNYPQQDIERDAHEATVAPATMPSHAMYGPAVSTDDYDAHDTSYYDMNVPEDRQSPILPGVKRPQSALHPMYSRSSKYSVATGITRF